jgi:hypothetical protein
MQLSRLKMIDPGEYKSVALVSLSGWLATSTIWAWFALHPLATYAAQALITVGCGLLTLVARHFLRPYLERNWPDGVKYEQAASALRFAATKVAKVDWFKFLRPLARPLLNLIRGAIARLRRRKES